MLWAYDNAVVNDLKSCINPNGKLNNTVKVMGDEGVMGVFAQLQEDKIIFPAIFLERTSDTPLDDRRYNFTRVHKGVPACIDPESNNIYLEKCLPIQLSYKIHVLATNTADIDEVTRQLLFRYTASYYVTMEVPYESKRQIRFGMSVNPDTPITKKSGSTDYIESGRLYESILDIQCHGAVLLHYTPRHMQRAVLQEIKAEP